MLRVLPLLVFFIFTSAPLFAQSVRITEFLTTNVNGIVDQDQSHQGWIELWNFSTTTKATLSSCKLTDGTTTWPIPLIELAPSERMVIFASGKNKSVVTEPLHTSFTLSPTGGTLSILSSANVALSTFNYPEQKPDVSWGRDETDTAVIATIQGSYAQPSPGERNNYIGTGVAGKVTFDKTSRAYTPPFTVTISQVTPDPDAQIRFTVNGTLPNATSPIYTAPLTVTSTQMIRARVFKTGLLPGETETQAFLLLDNTTANFSSAMPLMVLSNFGGGTPPDTTDQSSYLWVWEPAPPDNRSRFTNNPTLVSRTAIDRRGSSTLGNPKFNLNMELRKARDDDDRNQPLLGMPSHSDWVMGAPWDFDRADIRNPFVYALSRSIGRYATRTKEAEVFIDVNGGALNAPNGTGNDYFGVYNVTEKIRRGKERVDVSPLNMYDNGPVAQTGGYIYKVDRQDAGDSGFSAGGQFMAYYYPKEVEIKSPQRDPQEKYLTQYINSFNSALQSATWNNPVTGYAAWIDVPAAIDHHLLNVWPFNLDAFRLSGYWSKERGGKLIPGPIWDYDRTIDSTDGRDDNPVVWRSTVSDFGTDFFNYTWWNRMFQDINFYQKYIDRWQELRRGPFSRATVEALIDSMNAEISSEAITRDVARWGMQKRAWTSPFTGQVYPGTPAATGQIAEVQRIKDFLQRRANFMDSQWVGPVNVSVPEGNVPAGTDVTLTGPTPGTIYYTLDGTDPRPSGGGAPAAGVLIYTAGTPITITATTRLMARAYDPAKTALTGANNPPLVSKWGGITNVRYAVDPPVTTGQLAVTEINYHPVGPTPNELLVNPIFQDKDFEFIEIRNVGTTTVDLGGAQFTLGVQFAFSGANAISIQPGAYAVIVANPSAFIARYGSSIPFVGGWVGDLANEGEELVIKAADGSTLLDFKYDDTWYPDSDGTGSTLEYIGTSYTNIDFGNPANYQPSSEVNGSPGSAGSGNDGRIVINEILSNSSLPRVDAIELYNPTADPVDIGNWFLSDAKDPTSTEGYKQYKIPAGTVIAPGTYLVFTEVQFNPNGLWNPTPGPRGPGEFAFDGDHGDDAWLVEADATGNLIRFVDHVVFGAARQDESWGRWPNITGKLYPMKERTLLDETSATTPLPGLGADNSTPRFGPLVISEIQHTPVGDGADFEYVEIYNSSATDQPLADWQLRGAVDYFFRTEVIPAGGTLVVTSFSPTDTAKVDAFRAFYHLSANNSLVIAGPWETGQRLTPSGTVTLYRAETPPVADPFFYPLTLEDETAYSSDGDWPVTTEGSSLARLFPFELGDLATSWNAAVPNPGRPFNTPPNAVVDNLHALFNGAAITLDVRANDTDQDNDAFAITAVGTPLNGTATTDGATISYTPGVTFNGNDTFTYTLDDGFGGITIGTVNLTNAVPVATNDSLHVPFSGGDLTLDVLANDTDADAGDPRVVVSVDAPANGTAATDGTVITYTPGPNYLGVDQFSYTIKDGYGGTATAIVSLVNAAPVAVNDSALTDGSAVTVNVLENDSDADLDTLSIVSATDGVDGTVAIQGGSITYTPGIGFAGDDTFSYSVSDGHGGMASATVTIQSSVAMTQTEATTGEAVPGAPGMVYKSIQVPAIGNDLAVTFLADAQGAAGKKTLLLGGNPAVALFGKGDLVPGAAGLEFTKLGTPVTDDAGRTVFVGSFKGSGVSKKNNTAVFATIPGGATTMVARLGSSVPGVPGATYKEFSAVDGADGETVYVAKLSDKSTAVLSWDGAANGLVQRTGVTVNTPAGPKTIKSISVLGSVSGSPGHGRSHRLGEVAMRLGFTDKSEGVAIAAHDSATWTTTVTQVSGQSTGFAGAWKKFGPVALAEPGSMAALVDLDGLSKSSDTAVVHVSEGQATAVALEGGSSPIAGAVYKSFSDPVANIDGAVAFTAILDGTSVSKSNDAALFLRSPAGDLSSVAQLGGTVSDVPGTTWKKFVSFALPAGADAGPIVLAEISGASVNKKNKLGLWAEDSSGNLLLLARTGEAIHGGNSSKIVSKLTLLNALPPTQGTSRSFNDNRRIAYLATFTDGTQAIQIVRVP